MSQLINNNFSSIQQMAERINYPKPKADQGKTLKALSFGEILQSKSVKEAGDLKFSKHANERLLSRNIDLSKDQLERLEHGARKAEEKGIRESLVMVDNMAFIVNIKNNTVITAVNDSSDKIFTNIDGAVII